MQMLPLRIAAIAAVFATSASLPLLRSQPASGDYRIVKTAQHAGSGAIDYVFADADGRRLYVPRGTEVLVFDLDSLAAVGKIATGRARGVVLDPKSHHAFCSSSPVVMWDAKTLAIIKSIEVQGRPDAILFEPASERVFVFSHVAPNATVIDAKDGKVVGTIDLGGMPEQAVSDGKGRLFVNLEDKDAVAAVDVKTLAVVARYDLKPKGGGPAGLALDAKNRRLFAMCRNPQACVVLDADNGQIVATLPIGRGSDGGLFNPRTMEAFSSQGDGTLTVIRENSPSDFRVTQTVTTKSRAKTCTLDSKTDRVIVITTEAMPGSEPAPAKKGATVGPAMLDLIVIGK